MEKEASLMLCEGSTTKKRWFPLETSNNVDDIEYWHKFFCYHFIITITTDQLPFGVDINFW